MNSKRELVSGGIFGLWARGKGQEFCPSALATLSMAGRDYLGVGGPPPGL